MQASLRRWAVFIALAGLLAACSHAGEPSPVRGVVVEVEGTAFGDVPGFSIRTGGGETMRFRLALDDASQFPPEHLRTHMATLEPVRVWYRVEGGERVAYRLEDASR